MVVEFELKLNCNDAVFGVPIELLGILNSLQVTEPEDYLFNSVYGVADNIIEADYLKIYYNKKTTTIDCNDDVFGLPYVAYQCSRLAGAIHFTSNMIIT